MNALLVRIAARRIAALAALFLVAFCLLRLCFGDEPTPGPGGIFFRRNPRVVYAPAPVAEQKPAKPVEVAETVPVATEQPDKQVDSTEVIRRGDRVVRAGNGPMSDREQLIGDATAPPPDDSHKWFFSIIVDDGQASQALLYDLKHSQRMRAWIDLDDEDASWSHATVYKKDDATQAWRWKDIKITKYPVMILQPPAKLRDEAKPDSWEWGDPKIVVWQWDGYEVAKTNRAQIRSDSIRSALTAYITKLSQNPAFVRQALGPESKGPQAKAPPPTKGGHGQNDAGVSPPFALPKLPEPMPNMPVFPSDPTVVVQTNSTPAPQASGIWSLLFQALGQATTGTGFNNVLLLVLIGIQSFRAIRQMTGQKLLLDDATYSRIVGILQNLSGQSNQPKSGP